MGYVGRLTHLINGLDMGLLLLFSALTLESQSAVVRLWMPANSSFENPLKRVWFTSLDISVSGNPHFRALGGIYAFVVASQFSTS